MIRLLMEHYQSADDGTVGRSCTRRRIDCSRFWFTNDGTVSWSGSGRRIYSSRCWYTGDGTGRQASIRRGIASCGCLFLDNGTARRFDIRRSLYWYAVGRTVRRCDNRRRIASTWRTFRYAVGRTDRPSNTRWRVARCLSCCAVVRRWAFRSSNTHRRIDSCRRFVWSAAAVGGCWAFRPSSNTQSWRVRRRAAAVGGTIRRIDWLRGWQLLVRSDGVTHSL